MSKKKKYKLALQKIDNLSYSDIRGCVERYEDTGHGHYDFHATERDWEIARAVVAVVQDITTKALFRK
jgi:hypothetical protein